MMAGSPLTVEPQRGEMPVLQFCTPAQLRVDPSYQRSTDAQASCTMFTAIVPVVVEHGDDLSALLLHDILRDADQEAWMARFRDAATERAIGVGFAAKQLLTEAYAEALREIEDDEPHAPTAVASQPASQPARIDLSRAPSSMEQQADRWSGRE